MRGIQRLRIEHHRSAGAKGKIEIFSFVFKQFGPGESFVKSFGEYADSFGLTMKSLYYLVTGKVSTREIAGPIGIAVYTTQSWKLGIGYYLKLVAFITINLGIINLLPIPVLDGGLILLAVLNWSVNRLKKYLICSKRWDGAPFVPGPRHLSYLLHFWAAGSWVASSIVPECVKK
jgi:RIP metalloprotease RseP